jgi:hypothetical protein
MQYQQNLATLPIPVVVLDAYSNELSELLPLVSELERELVLLQGKKFVRVTREP